MLLCSYYDKLMRTRESMGFVYFHICTIQNYQLSIQDLSRIGIKSRNPIFISYDNSSGSSIGQKTWQLSSTWPKRGSAIRGTRWRTPWGRGLTSSRPRWTRPARTWTCSWGKIHLFWPWMKWGPVHHWLTSRKFLRTWYRLSQRCTVLECF